MTDTIITMAEIVKTLKDEDILAFIEEYKEYMSLSLYAKLITEISDDNITSSYLKELSKNIYTIMRDWDEEQKKDDVYEELNLNNDIYDDIYKDDLDILYMFEEELCENNPSPVNDIIATTMTIIKKMKNKQLKLENLIMFFNQILPRFRFFLGVEKYNEQCRDEVNEYLEQILGELSDDDIQKFINNTKNNLSINQEVIAVTCYKKDFFKKNMMREKRLTKKEYNQLKISINEKEKLKEFLDQNLNTFLDSGKYSEEYLEMCLNNINYILHKLKDDDLTESVITFVSNNMYDFPEETPLILIMNISNNIRKAALIEGWESEVRKAPGFCHLLLESIDDFKIYKELYNKYEELLSKEEIINLIYSKKDEEKAFELLLDQYFEIADQDEEEKNIDIYQIQDLFTALPENKQNYLWKKLSLYLTKSQQNAIIPALSNYDLKKQQLELIEQEYKETEYQKSLTKKRFN